MHTRHITNLVPGAVRRGLDHVVAVEPRNGDEGNGLGVKANLLNEVGNLLDDLLETVFRPLGGVHLVNGDNELLDTKGVGQESMLASLPIFRDTSLKLTSTGSDDKNRTVGLGGTSDHVLDEITVSRGI